MPLTHDTPTRLFHASPAMRRRESDPRSVKKMFFPRPPPVFPHLCTAKIGCGSDVAGKGKLFPAPSLALRYHYFTKIGHVRAFRYLCSRK